MAYQYQGPKQFKSTDEEGMVFEVTEALRSIPHLPAALIDGIDDPNATERERQLRRRALAEASQWVLPLVVSGVAAAAIPATGGASVLIGAVADAAGFGLGSAGHAALMDEDPVQAGLTGAAFGGVLGAAGGLLKQGAAHAAEEAAKAAARRPIEESLAESARVATQTRAETAALRGRVAGRQADAEAWRKGTIFSDDAVARQVNDELEAARNLQSRSSAVQGFTTAPRTPLASALDATGPARPTSWAAHASVMPNDIVYVAAARARGESPAQAVAKLKVTGKAGPKQPKTFKEKPKAGGDAPPTEPTDSLTALHGITPTVLEQKASGTAPVVGIARDTFAADEVLGGAFRDAGDAILRGDLTRLKKAAGRGAQAVTLSDTWREMTSVLSRAVEPARKTLQRMGAAGTELALVLDNVFDAWKNGAGEHMAATIKALEGYSKADRIHIGEVLEGLAAPKTISHGNAADKLRDVLGWYADEAEKLGIRQLMEDGSTREFTRMTGYMPHYIDRKTIDRLLKNTGSPAFQAVHDALVAGGHSKGRLESIAYLKTIRHTPPEFRTGPLNFARSHLKLPYEKDPLVAVNRYIYSVRKRIEAARQFGGDYKGVLPYYERIHMDGGDWKTAQYIFSAFNDALPKQYPNLIRAMTTYNTWTMLSTAGIVQPAQLLNTAAITSYASTVKAIGSFLKDPRTADYMATKAGVHINEVLQDLTGVTLADDPTNTFMRVILLEPLDKANRIVSALAGRFELDVLAERMAKASPAQQAKIADKLERIGISPAELIAVGNKPTEKMYRDAAYRVSANTQHRSGAMDLPELKNHPLGKIVYQFRAFALQQAGFLEKDVLRPARTYWATGGKRGSLAPLARYTAGLGPTGAVVGETVRGIKGTTPPDDPRVKMVESLALAGGFGIYYDTINAMVSGKDRFLSFLAGPGIGELAAYAGDLGNVAQGSTEQLAKHLLRRTPIIGQPLSNYWFFPK